MTRFGWVCALLLAVICVYGPAGAQTDSIKINTVKRFGTAGNDKSWVLRADAENNLYITGSHQGTINWGGTSTTAAPNQGAYFTASFKTDGTLRWVTSGDSIGADGLAGGFDLELDNQGNLFNGGRYSALGRIFGTRNIFGAVLGGMSKDNGVPFLARNFSAATPSQEAVRAIAADNAGFVYVVGYTNKNNSQALPFTAKVNATTGALVWSKEYDPLNQNRSGSFPSELIYANGRLFLAVYIQGGYLGTVRVNLPTNVLEINPDNGEVLKVFDTQQFKDFTGRMVLGPDNKLYVVSYAANNRGKLGLANGDSVRVPYGEQVVAGFSLDGKLQKIYRLYTQSPIIAGGTAIAFSGNRLVVGTTTQGKLESPLGTLTNKGYLDIALLVLDTATTSVKAQALYGGTDEDVISGMNVLPNGDLALTGWFRETVNFGPGKSITSAGINDIFLAVTSVRTCTRLQAKPIVATSAKLCPNTGATLAIDPGAEATVRWSTGQNGLTTDISSPGRYKVEVRNACSAYTDSIDIAASVVPAFAALEPDTLCQGTQTERIITVTDGTTLTVVPTGGSSAGRPTLTIALNKLTINAEPALATATTFTYTIRTLSPDLCPASVPFSVRVKPSTQVLVTESFADTVCPTGSVSLNLSQRQPVRFGLDPQSPQGLAENSPGVFSASGLGLPEREVTFQLLATAVDYCPATVPYVVTVQAVPERCDPLLIPNIATPGSATANATFALKGITPGTATVKIYNRWGLEVFSSTSYTNNWPTTDTPPGLYFYALDAPTRGLAGRKGWVEVTKK